MHSTPESKHNKIDVYDPSDISNSLAGAALLGEMLRAANEDTVIGSLDIE